MALGALQKLVPSELPLGTSLRPPCVPGAPLSWTSFLKPPEGAWLLESPPGLGVFPRLPSRRGLLSLALHLSPNTLHPLPHSTAPTWRMQYPRLVYDQCPHENVNSTRQGLCFLFTDLLMT